MIDVGRWADGYYKSTVLQEKAVGKKILNVELVDDSVLRLVFEDGTGLEFSDEGQSCCERRYMSVDGDDLAEFIGASYVEAFIKDAPEIEDEWGVHEVQFLEVSTSKGSITVSNHNEHNGYYGGFSVIVKEVN